MRLSELPTHYQELFRIGHFPRSEGTLIPSTPTPVGDSAWALFFGVPALLAAIAPAAALLAEPGRNLKELISLIGGTKLADVPAVLAAIIGVMLCVALMAALGWVGVAAFIQCGRGFAESWARRRGECHYGLWMDAQ